MVISSGAKRVRPECVDAIGGLRSNSDEKQIANWFLNDNKDVRSSYFHEIASTQFVIQGLELDWICLSWGADLRLIDGRWVYKNFTGTSWKNVHQTAKKEFILNSYRVLLTRARQGIVLFIPKGNPDDITRAPDFYNETYQYLKEIGIPII